LHTLKGEIIVNKLSSFKDPVKVDTGYISGTLLGEPGNKVHVYRGIPYAAPPVGELRWQPPKPSRSWTGIRECTAFSSMAPQLKMPAEGKSIMPESEDCLYLNVYTPAKSAGDKLPVMVWMHGGGYWTGSGNEPMFNNGKLSMHGVVLVNVNMRLASLGLLAHGLLSKESSDGVSGNYMFLDMIAALQWVQRNIAAFGGNPDNVTIFGESGGGAKVSTLVASPLARGLFHRAICESGAAFAPPSPGIPLTEMQELGERLFAVTGVDKEKNPLAAARALPWRKIIEADSALSLEMNKPAGQGIWDGTVDGWLLPDSVENIFRAGKENVVSLITTANLGELKGPGLLLMPWIIPIYTCMLSSESKAGSKVFAGIFDQVPDGWRREGCVSVHAIELPYVFGSVDMAEAWTSIYNIASQSGAKTNVPEVSGTDRKVSEEMMKIWSRFAMTGDPSIPGFIEWPVWEQKSDKYLYVNDNFRVKTGYSKLPG
jgi:para-nitrobenzyl esterase